MTRDESPAGMDLGAQSARSFSSRLSSLSDVLAMLFVLTGLSVFFGVATRHFWTGQTVRIIVNQIPDLTVVAVGMTLVVVIGGIDLSFGSVLALAGSVLGIAPVDWAGHSCWRWSPAWASRDSAAR